MSPAPFDVFVSYNSSDAPFVRTIVDTLQIAGVSAWMDRRELVGGDRWMRHIEDQLRTVPAFVACVGTTAPDRWCRSEIEVALGRGHRDQAFRIVPLLLPDVHPDDIPPFLGEYTAVRLTDASDPAQIQDLVRAIRGEAVPPAQLDWVTALRDAGIAQVANEVAALRHKYVASIYAERPSIDQSVADFLASNAQTLLVVGEAGAGKTNLTCRLAEQRCRERPVLLFRAGIFAPGVNELEAAIVGVIEAESGLRLGRPLFPNLQRVLRGTRMLIIIDAINEATTPAVFVEMIASTLRRARTAPVQFCLTCRRADWRLFRDDPRITDSLWRPAASLESADSPHGLTLGPFTETEFDDAWDRYRTHFGVEGELEGNAREICRQPLMMRFVCEAFRDRRLPPTLNTLDVFDRYWAAKVDPDPRRGKALFDTVGLLRERRENTLTEDALAGMLGRDVYGALLSEEVILQVRVDRYTHAKLVGFTYEAFFEYCLARAILLREAWHEREAGDLVASVNALLDEASLHRMLGGAVEFIVLHFQEHTALPAMLDLFDRSPEWKQRCCALLPRFSGFDSRFDARLSQLAADPDNWVRWSASLATAQLRSDDDFDAVVSTWFGQPDWRLRESAATAYAWRALTEDRWQHVLVLAADSYWRVRRAIANSLNRHIARGRLSLIRLAELLRHLSWRVRDVGIIAQRDLVVDPLTSRRLLEPLLTDPSERIRFSVAKFVGTFRQAGEFVPLLAAMASDSSDWVRKRVVTSVATFASDAPDAVGGVLTTLAKDDAASVRWEVARVLASMPASRVTADLLMALAADPVADIGAAALFSRRRRDGALPVDLERTLSVVSPDAVQVREAVARVSDLISVPRDIDAGQNLQGAWRADYYLSIVRAIRLAIERVGVEHAGALLDALVADPEEGVRWAVAQTLSSMPLARHDRFRIAGALLCDRHVWVRQAMIEEMTSALLETGSTLRQCVTALVQDPDVEVRLALALAATRLAGSLGDEGHLILEALGHDADADVRRTAGALS